MTPEDFFYWCTEAAFTLVMASLVLGFIRLAKGPSFSDRVVALDMMTVSIVAFCALFAIRSGATAFLDVAVVLALIGFLATVALARFAEQWKDDRLVMDKWFSLQVMMAKPDDVANVVTRLTARPDFDMRNPNRFRAVIGALGGHLAGFHHPSGKGYELMADWLIKLDALNPQTTARMSSAFDTWKRFDEDRQQMIRAQLERIMARETLSRDTSEMVGRILAA